MVEYGKFTREESHFNPNFWVPNLFVARSNKVPSFWIYKRTWFGKNFFWSFLLPDDTPLTFCGRTWKCRRAASADDEAQKNLVRLEIQ